MPEDIGGGYWYFQIFARAVTRADEAVIRDTVRAYEARHNIHLGGPSCGESTVVVEERSS